MAKVIIAEKPSVAKNIADAFKIKTRKDGYFEGNGYYITWAFGHLLQLYDAKDYDESMKAGVKFIHAAYGFGTIREKVPEIHKFEDLVEAADKVFEG